MFVALYTVDIHGCPLRCYHCLFIISLAELSSTERAHSYSIILTTMSYKLFKSVKVPICASDLIKKICHSLNSTKNNLFIYLTMIF